MSVAKTYQHFCPVARSLELIGEKWSLLVIRDLLRGPLRFTDLLRYLGGITPKWLTARLRDLEKAGIVARKAGRGREVWYELTPRGLALGPVVEALAAWGIEYAMRPPRPGEALFPEQTLSAMAAYLNHKKSRAAAPALWRFLFDEGEALALQFDGSRWTVKRDAAGLADVTVSTSLADWIAFLFAGQEAPAHESDVIRIDGKAAAVREFGMLLGRRTPARPRRPAALANAGAVRTARRHDTRTGI